MWITGVGLVDYVHGQCGVAPNDVQLDPVLNAEFPSGDTG